MTTSPNPGSINEILRARGDQYGPFDVQARLAQDFKAIARETFVWYKLEPDQREALEMILHKISRILNGNPNHVDSWSDICGYSQLVVNRLEKPTSESPSH